ncbi:MAG: methionyl-tRNA formyltransferase [Alphaproteobacteria bacterium]|nr:methionyl-tRNA formyltransferase [Alphaproteobacteria bacterium]MBQ3117216.1 methionyl-tRNA formyltransferase [Alphaproteobacteria bacterium]
MKVVFMGTPDFAVPVLEKLAEKHQVVCVYTQPPRPAGKGYKLTPSPVHQKAEEFGISVRTPVSLRKSEEQQAFADLQADVAVVCAYGLILPQAILDAPKKGCINIHASLLPRWRGAAPIQRAIQAGDTQSGVTIMQMDAGLDTGDMLLVETCPIQSDTTAQMLHDTLSEMGARLIIQALDLDLKPIAQPTEGITYAEKIQKSEALINWNLSATQICRNIMAFNPYPTAYTLYKGERIKIFTAVAMDEITDKSAGTILDEDLKIACGNGTVLKVLTLQRAGKKMMSASDFMKGNSLTVGERFAI